MGGALGKPVGTGPASPGSIPAPMLMQLDPISWQTSWLLPRELPPDWLAAEPGPGMAVTKSEQGDKRPSALIKAGNT